MGHRIHHLLSTLLVAIIAVTLLPVAAPPAPAFAQDEPPPFQSPIGIPGTVAEATSVAMGDLNGDGALDLVIGNDGGMSQIALDLRRTGFATSDLPNSGRDTSGVAVGDLNGDGALDLVLANSGAASQVFLNVHNNSRPFREPCDLPNSGRATTSVAVGDLNGDGALDLVLANSGAASQIYLGDGQGGFGAAMDLAGSARATASAALGYVNGDDNLDLVLANSGAASQLYLGDGQGGFGAAIDLAGSGRTTTGVAVGDLNGDGRLDLVFSNRRVSENSENPVLSQVYMNQGGTTFKAADLTLSGRNTANVAIGDLGGDGALDLVLVNRKTYDRTCRCPALTPSEVFHNDGRAILVAPVSLPQSEQSTSSVAVGDLNGDRKLDLVLGNEFGSSLVYQGDGTGNFQKQAELPSNDRITTAVAVGDLNGDGKLDLVLGNWFGASQIYFNNGSPAFAAPVDLPGEQGQNTESVALGDLDGDGDLDLVLGNVGKASQVYLNTGNGSFAPPLVLPISDNNTYSVALGDLDGDGDLDLVLGNAGTLSQLYLNNGRGAFGGPRTLPLSGRDTYGVALGDLDGDSDLDIVLANAGAASQIYFNYGGGSFYDEGVSDLPNSDRTTYSVAIQDFDGDGALDLVLGNSAQPSQLYRNNGWGSFESLDLPGDAATYAVAAGDLNGDGRPDIVLGNYGEASQIVALRRGFGRHPLGAPPRVSIGQPGGAAAPFFAVAAVFEQQYITIPFTLFDDEGGRVHVRGEYSLDGGGAWRAAIPRNPAETRNLAASRDGEEHSFVWDVYGAFAQAGSEAFFGQSDNVVFRLVALPDYAPAQLPVSAGSPTLAGSYPYGATSAISFPFRVRGTLARVTRSDGQPAPDALVYRLTADQVLGAPPLKLVATNAAQKSDTRGYVPSRNRIAPGDRLIALWPIHEEPKFSLYHTSAPVGSQGFNTPAVGSPGVQTLVVRPEHPLMLLTLNVSLEWDATSDLAFLARLERDLQRASELLYNWTDGQVALGALTLYHDRELWEVADIKIYASNKYNPNATQGGITPVEREDPDRPTVRYEPGSVRMGATWSRSGDAGENSGDDWARALAHELGHFALYLDETYLGLNERGQLISVGGCLSPMADPYRDDYGAFRPDASLNDACRRTLSYRSVGRSEWGTIKRFYDRTPEQTLTGQPFSLNAPASFETSRDGGPRVLPLAVTRLEQSANNNQTVTLSPTLLTIVGSDGRYLASSEARAFLRRGDSQLIDLGAPTGDQVLVRGARLEDELCVFDTRRQTLGCIQAGASSNTLRVAVRADWRPELLITPVTSTSLRLALLAGGVGTLPAGAALKAQLFPTEGTAQTFDTTLSLDDGIYSGSFTNLGDGVTQGYVRVWVEGDSSPARETISDFALGGNPAPRRRSNTRNKKRAPAVSTDGQATLFAEDVPFQPGEFLALQKVAVLPPPPPWAIPVSAGYRLLASRDALLNPAISLNMSYTAGEVPQGQEANVGAYYWDEATRTWKSLPSEQVAGRREVAMQIEPKPGLYVLMLTLPVRPGWNLLAFPWPDEPVRDALASLGGAGRYTTVYGYTQQDGWQTYDVGVAPEWDGLVNTLRVMRGDRAYWVNVSEGVLQPPPSAATSALINLTPPPATYYGFVPGVAAAEQVTIKALIDGQVCGETTTRPLASKAAFVIRVVSAVEQPGCGADGKLVTLVAERGAPVSFSAPVAWANGRVFAIGAHRAYLPLVRGPRGAAAGASSDSEPN